MSGKPDYWLRTDQPRRYEHDLPAAEIDRRFAEARAAIRRDGRFTIDGEARHAHSTQPFHVRTHATTHR